MKYENFRQALRYLLLIVQHNPNAAEHSALLRLPEAVRGELLSNDSTLHKLMASRTVKTSYTSSNLSTDDVTSVMRMGRLVKTFNLSKQEQSEIVALLSHTSNANRQQLKQDLRQPIRGVSWICLSGRSQHTSTVHVAYEHTAFESGARVNYTHYSVDVALPHGSTPFNGEVVRVFHLFKVKNVALACVSWGKKLDVDASSGCREYRFPERGATAQNGSASSSSVAASLPTVIRVERLFAYVHFGVLPGARLLLNRFYIPRGVDCPTLC